MRYELLVKEQISSKATIGANVRIGIGTVIEDGCWIGDNVMIGHYCVLRPNTIVGHDTKITHYFSSEEGARIGNYCNLGLYSHLTKDTIMEDWVFYSIRSMTLNDRRLQYGRVSKKDVILEPPIIKCGARIGASVIIMPGVTIGRNTLIGTRSLVTKDIPNGQFWYGSPAVFKGLVSEKFLNQGR